MNQLADPTTCNARCSGEWGEVWRCGAPVIEGDHRCARHSFLPRRIDPADLRPEHIGRGVHIWHNGHHNLNYSLRAYDVEAGTAKVQKRHGHGKGRGPQPPPFEVPITSLLRPRMWGK